MRSRCCIAPGVQVLDEERVDHPAVDHELFTLNLVLDLLNQFTRVSLHFVSFSLQGVALALRTFVAALELGDASLESAELL